MRERYPHESMRRQAGAQGCVHTGLRHITGVRCATLTTMTATEARPSAVTLTSDGLSVRGVRQRFGSRVVLDDVDLDARPGEVRGLLGPNGAGKTTLMRIVFGVIEPDAGDVMWRGNPAATADRQRWGYMPQERGLYREMRTVEHLAWLARLYGLDRREARRRADELLDKLDLGDRAHDPIRDLSGGMAQRVQLAAAMVHGPELLVLDEPFAGLDPTAVDFLSDVVREHVSSGGHLLFSSHQLDLVEDLCEVVTMIHDGRVVMDGAVRDLKRSSRSRYLRVDVDVQPSWIERAPATVERSSAGESRLLLEAGADAGAVLDEIRAHVTVDDFAVDAPTLSELFLAAIRSDSS